MAFFLAYFSRCAAAAATLEAATGSTGVCRGQLAVDRGGVGGKRAVCRDISMGRIAICLTVSLNFNCCREGVGERRGIGGWGRGRGAAYWRCMQRTLKLLIAFGRQPQRRVVLLSPHTVRLVFPPLPSCCVPLFGSAATPTVCLVLLSLSFFCSCMKMSCIHTLTHTHSRHLVLSHKMCDVYLPLRPTRLC